MTQQSQPNGKTDAVPSLPRRATNVVLAATLAASMVPSAAFAAFEDEVNQAVEANAQDGQQNQNAVDQADELYTQSLESEGIALAADDGTSEAVTDAYGEAVADGDAASLGLDHANLPDGQYTVKLMMMNINGRQVSMSNGAVGNVVEGTTGQHLMTLDVVNGEYWLTMRWVPLERNLGGTPFVGYLANLAYFEDYSFTPYLQGTKVAAKVLSQYINEDGTPVYDDYNRPGSDSFVGDNIYPKDVQIKISGASLEDGMQPVHVFVPVMDAIMTGAGDQNAYVKLFWNSLSVNYLATDKSELKTSLDAANALEQGKKSNDAWNALESAISTAQGVYDNKAATQDSVNNAATTLNAAVKAFQDSADISGSTDPFDGVIETEAFYIAGQKFVDGSGNAIASGDAAFNQTTLSIRRVDAAEGRYEVKLQTRYTVPAGPVVTSVSYGAASDGADAAKTARKVRDSANETGWHTVEWRIYVDDLTQQQKLDVQCTANGEVKAQTLFITPLKADAKLGSALQVMLGSADYYRSNSYLDATGLFLAIEDAKAVEQGKKTDDAWKTLQDAIDAAQAVYDSTSKQQDDCDKAVETLNDAVETFKNSPDDTSATFGMEQGVWYTNSTEKWSGTKQGIGGTTPFDNQSVRYKLNEDGTFTVRVKTYGKLYAVDQVAYGSADQAATKTGQWNTGLGYKGPETMWDFTVSDLSQVTAYVTGRYQNGTTLTAEPFALSIGGLSAGDDCGFAKAAVQLDDGELYQAWARGKALTRDASKLDAWQQLQSALSAAEGVRSKVTTSMKNGVESVSQSDIDAATQRVNEAIEAYRAPATDPRYGMEKGVFYSHFRLNDQVDIQSGSGVTDAPISIGKSTFRVADDGKFEITLACPEVSGNTGATVQSIKVGTTDSMLDASAPQQIGGGAGVAQYRFTVDSLSDGVYAWMTYVDASGTKHSNVRFRVTLDLSETNGSYGFTRLSNQDDTKKDLYAQIVAAKAVEQGKKTDSAWSDLQNAIQVAESVYAQDSPATGANTAAAATLKSAVDAFNDSADVETPAKDSRYGLTVGTWYELASSFKSCALSGDAGGTMYQGMFHYLPKADATYDIDLYTWKAKGVTSVKYSTSDDVSAAKDAMQTGDTYWRINVSNPDQVIYAWVTYTDNDGAEHADTSMTISHLNLTNSSFKQASNQIDKGLLWAANKDAQSIEYGKKPENLWVALCEARDASSSLLRNATGKTQEDIDAATTAVNDAVRAYREAADDPNGGKYGLEVGGRYSNWRENLLDAEGNQLYAADEGNPFYYTTNYYSLNEDGTFDITLQGLDKDGENSISSVKWSYGEDLSAAAEAPKIAGRVGTYTPGPADWKISGVDDISKPLHLWVTYTDKQGVEHKDAKFTVELYGLSMTADHSFVHLQKVPDTSQLYLNLKRAEAIEKNPNKTNLAWITFDLVRETNYVYYVNNAAADTQENIDAAAKQVADAISSYENSRDIADFADLDSAVAEAQRLVDAGVGDFQDKAFELLSAQLEQAKKVDADHDYQQSKVDEAAKALASVTDAYKASATKTSLKALSDAIAEATELKAGGCVNGLTPISDLGKATTAAQGVYDKATGFADDQIIGTDAEVKDATTALNEAIEAFKEACKVDKSALESAISQAKAIEQGKKSNEAFQTLQQAIAAADKVANDGEASQDDVDNAVEALKSAVDAFNASADVVDGLDFANLEDGAYAVNVDMYKAYDRESKSMSDQAINHEVELTVKNGEYFLTFDFQGLKYLGKFGYLGWLKYYDQGYTYNQYGSPQGNLVNATVLSTQKNADGTDVYDEFNTDGSEYKLFTGLYPDKVQIKYVQSARDDAEGFIPLQVFVPVMESIAAGNGTQDVLAKVDKASLKKKEAAAVDTAELSAGIASAENALATSKKSDADNAKLQAAVAEAKAVLSKEGTTQDEVDAAHDALQKAIDEFNAAPDAVVVDKSALTDAIAKAKAVKQGNKTDSAWETLQTAIAKAEGVASNADATQADVDTAATTLNSAVDTFNASADKPADTQLDFANLPAGTYSIAIDMYKMNRTDKSMSDAAINHKAKLTVDENGEYWLTFDFASVKSGTTNGYLGSLSYYDEGYTYSGAKVNGSLVAGNVVDYQTGVDGKQYPNHVTVKFVKTARNDADHFIPLQVFVPVMEEIAADCGTQDVLAKYDPSSVQKLDGEIPDQTEPGVNGSGSDNSGSNTNGTTVGAPTAKSAAATAAKTAASGSSSLAKTGDDAGNGLLATAFAGVTAAAVAAYAAMRRRFGKQEGEE